MNACTRAVVLTVLAIIFASPSLLANTVTFSFGSCAQLTPAAPLCLNTDAGTNTLTYTTGGLTVAASAFQNSGAPIDLYVKNLGAGETGLGTMIDSQDHEITPDDFVNFDFSNLANNGIFSATLTLESLQAGEGFALCQGSTVGLLGSNCQYGLGVGTGTKTITVTWTGSTNDIIGITGFNAPTAGADTLVRGLTVKTPEPSTLTLLGFGLLGLGIMRRHLLNR